MSRKLFPSWSVTQCTKAKGILKGWATLLYRSGFFLVDSQEERSWRQPQESQQTEAVITLALLMDAAENLVSKFCLPRCSSMPLLLLLLLLLVEVLLSLSSLLMLLLLLLLLLLLWCVPGLESILCNLTQYLAVFVTWFRCLISDLLQNFASQIHTIRLWWLPRLSQSNVYAAFYCIFQSFVFSTPFDHIRFGRAVLWCCSIWYWKY